MNIPSEQITAKERKRIFDIMDIIEPKHGRSKVQITNMITELLVQRRMKVNVTYQSKDVEMKHRYLVEKKKKFNKLVNEFSKKIKDLKLN